MRKITKTISILLDSLIVFFLSTMVILVFLNGVLRYLFNSGITWSEEIARFAFVWLVFLGAIKAFKEGAHIIVDLLIAKLPKKMQKLTFLLTNILIICTMALFLNGVFSLMELNANARTPAANLPQNSLYVVGVVVSVSIILISLYQMFMIFFSNTEKPKWMKEDTLKSESGETK